MERTTTLAQLVATERDSMGYLTYIFQLLEDETKFIMCTRFPNWDHKNLVLGEIGFLTYMFVTAGKDTWFDGVKEIPYKYSTLQFLKFVEKPKSVDQNYVM